MFYELKIAIKTIQFEGPAPLFHKISEYFSELLQAPFLTIPENLSLEELVDFVCNTKLISAGQTKSEFLELARLVKEKCPVNVLEIGTARGGSLATWCQLAHPLATIVSVDLPGGIHGGGFSFWRGLMYRRIFPKRSQKLHLIRADAHSPITVANVAKVFPNGIDFLFIDADHRYEGVKSEFELYWQFVNAGGIVVVCDIAPHPKEFNCQADRFWGEIKDKFCGTEIMARHGVYCGGFGIIRKEQI